MAEGLAGRIGCMVLTGALLAACGGPPEGVPGEFSGGTMGTSYLIKLGSGRDLPDTGDLHEKVDRLLYQVEQLASTYRTDSALSRFNASRSTDWIKVPAALCEAVARSQDISRVTRGAFDITVGPLVNLWGFGPGALANAPPTADQIASARSRVGYQQVHTRCSDELMRKDREDVYIDLSAWAKGDAVDQVAELLDRHSIVDYLVEIGGELRVRGYNPQGKPWSIAIEQPQARDRGVHSVVHLTGGAVATSGDYRNFLLHKGQRYSHAIDPRSGSPVSHSGASVTVLHNSAATADALATALLVLGPKAGLALAERQGIACRFLVRGMDGIEVMDSPAFQQVPQS